MSEAERRTCKGIHIYKLNGMWWCRAPYDPAKLEQAEIASGKTMSEAYIKLIERMAMPAFISPLDTPESRARHAQWGEAERRQRYGLHRPWSSLDCYARNGY